jgi:hypothetical protein
VFASSRFQILGVGLEVRETTCVVPCPCPERATVWRRIAACLTAAERVRCTVVSPSWLDAWEPFLPALDNNELKWMNLLTSLLPRPKPLITFPSSLRGNGGSGPLSGPARGSRSPPERMIAGLASCSCKIADEGGTIPVILIKALQNRLSLNGRWNLIDVNYLGCFWEEQWRTWSNM